MKKTEKFSQTLTFKAIIVTVLTLFLLIPRGMILNLIEERQERSSETISRINAKWSNAQTICGPVLSIPYLTVEKDEKKETQIVHRHKLNITPEELNIQAQLFPEERYYGIYKTTLYKSNIHITGKFDKINLPSVNASTILWKEAYISIGFSDLRGITNEVDFRLNGEKYSVEAGEKDPLTGNKIVVGINEPDLLQSEKELSFNCDLNLNGSGEINFIPLGKNSKVKVVGAWKSPGFIGNFTPEEKKISNNEFQAQWNVLYFNRNIPKFWVDENTGSFNNSSFGVNLVNTVDHYQQNMRSAKYALMFIVLTFIVFFFVEALTKKKIHPLQYTLVGIALILFYSLLLSLSEQINFAVAYLIASFATIGLIIAYAYSIFKNKMQTGILTVILCLLYMFLFVILQLEDIALLIGSIGLFIILGIIMFASGKINWYKQEEIMESDKTPDPVETLT